MIDTRLESALSRFEPDEFTRVKAIAESATLDLLKGRGAGSEWLGWRRIVRDPDRDLLGAVRKHAEQIRSESDLLVVCGIGGSYLGAKALVDLFPDKQEDGLQVRFAGYHIGGSALERLIREMETPRPDGEEKRIHINVISKSGSTLETALAFRVLRGWMEKKYGSEAKRRITVTTGPDGGVLNPMVHKLGYKRFVIPEDTGGRFSVLTPVGLLPVAAAGLDIEALFAGAESMAAELERPDIRILTYASARYLLHQAGVSIDVVGSFEPELESLTAWIQQLLGESEGKEGKGIFPVSAAWSTDLHSIGQMVQEGRRNVMETLLVVDQPISNLKVPTDPEDSDGLGYLDGLSFHQINRTALEGTVEAHSEGGVPVVQIHLDRLHEETAGELIYFYEFFTAVYVYMLELNPFDQPGVEGYKKAMYRRLKMEGDGKK